MHITWQQQRKKKEINTTEISTSRMGLIIHSTSVFFITRDLGTCQAIHQVSQDSRETYSTFQLHILDANAWVATWNHRLKTSCLRDKHTKVRQTGRVSQLISNTRKQTGLAANSKGEQQTTVSTQHVRLHWSSTTWLCSLLLGPAHTRLTVWALKTWRGYSENLV